MLIRLQILLQVTIIILLIISRKSRTVTTIHGNILICFSFYSNTYIDNRHLILFIFLLFVIKVFVFKRLF